PTQRVTQVTLANGQPLDPNAIYRVAMPDFLAQGGDGLKPVTDTIAPDRITIEAGGHTFRDVFIDTVRQWPQPVDVKTDGRVTIIDAPKAAGAPGTPSC